MYWSGHPENYLFSLLRNVLIGRKHPKNTQLKFENKISDQMPHITKQGSADRPPFVVRTSSEYLNRLTFSHVRKPAKVLTIWCFTFHVWYSASFLAEMSVRSAQKTFIFIIYENVSWIKVSKKHLI